MEYVIELVTQDDMPEIMQMYKDHRYEGLGIPFKRSFYDMIERGHFFKICIDDNLAAFCGYAIKPRKGCVEIEHLCVRSVYRNHHLAVRLLCHIANQTDVGFLPMPIVLSAIDGAKNNGFYDKLAKRIIEVRKCKTCSLKVYEIDRGKLKAYEERSST